MPNEKVQKIKAPYRGLETWRRNNVSAQIWNDLGLQTFLKKSSQFSAIFIIVTIFIFLLIKIGMLKGISILWIYAFLFIVLICYFIVNRAWRMSIVPDKVWNEPHLKAYLKTKGSIIALTPVIPFYIGSYAKIPILTYIPMIWYLGVALYFGFKKQTPKVNSSSDHSKT
jgi:hypothetical protein